MFFGYDMEKFLLLLVVAAVLIGPERLPALAEKLASFTRSAKTWLAGARTRVKEEMGDDFDDVDWQKLDPRQYDPRRIIRDALLDDAPIPTVRAAAAGAAVVGASEALAGASDEGGSSPASRASAASFNPDADVPFDSEAT